MLILADTLLDLIYENTLPAIVNAAVLGILSGGFCWATAFYRRASSIDKNVQKLNENMKNALARLDLHEKRIDAVELSVARLQGP